MRAWRRVFFCAVVLQVAPRLLAAEQVDYMRQIKPLLSAHCYTCHGVLQQKSGLRLDTAELMRKGGDSGPAIVPGRSSESLIVDALTGANGVEQMPREAKPFSDDQVALIKTWIDQGAIAPEEKALDDASKHWSFQPPVRPSVPAVSNQGWVKNPVDAFVAAEHQRRGLRPSDPTAKGLLLRRVYLDLIGLPPTRAELHAFLADPAADAYEKVVDRLLEDPHYGERWGRHWMDVWRYSDWDGHGSEIRESRPHIWRWRDWIVESVNADKPYDRMIVEMLAADEVAPGDTDALRATGFLVRNWFLYNRNVWMDNTVEHTAKAFLGLTMNCARCHDHKYDPIAQTDYYRFRAFFEPCNFRTDRVAGQADVNVDGLVRIFDADAKAQTFLMARGDEKRPDKEHPLTPGLARVLQPGGEVTISEVPLPLAVYYPGASEQIQQEEQARADSALVSAREVLSTTAKALADASRAYADALSGGATAEQAKKVQDAATALEGAQKAFDAAETGIASVRARIAADRANFSTPPAANAAELALAAGQADRRFKLCQAEQSLFAAEQQAVTARKAVKPDDEKTKTAASEAEAKIAPARAARDAALAVLNTASDQYTHFGEVYPKTSSGRRAALARWIAAQTNPLTARVAINHIWLRHFGNPLVPTVFDFGLNGKPPTHPALIDWLAVELMENGWHMKPIHRLMVTSAAYRMRSGSGEATSANAAIDPDNQFLWRMNARRMESEVVRDSALHVAGQLDGKMFGPDLDPATGLTVPRRSLYFRSSKEKKVTFLALFDSPNVVDCYRRTESIVPQQALAMANSPLVLSESRVLAGKVSGEVGGDAKPETVAAFIQASFEQLLCRPATPQEQTECAEFLQQQTQKFSEAAKLSSFPAASEAAVKPSAEPHQRAREDLIHVLMNHNDFVTVR